LCLCLPRSIAGLHAALHKTHYTAAAKRAEREGRKWLLLRRGEAALRRGVERTHRLEALLGAMWDVEELQMGATASVPSSPLATPNLGLPGTPLTQGGGGGAGATGTPAVRWVAPGVPTPEQRGTKLTARGAEQVRRGLAQGDKDRVRDNLVVLGGGGGGVGGGAAGGRLIVHASEWRMLLLLLGLLERRLLGPLMAAAGRGGPEEEAAAGGRRSSRRAGPAAWSRPAPAGSRAPTYLRPLANPVNLAWVLVASWLATRLALLLLAWVLQAALAAVAMQHRGPM
jgi:hypothetical protein